MKGKNISQEIKTVRDLMNALRQGPYTSVGCYLTFFLTEDGAVLSHAGVRSRIFQEARLVRDSRGENNVCVDRIVAMVVNWENPELICDETGYRIESAYAEPDTTE